MAIAVGEESSPLLDDDAARARAAQEAPGDDPTSGPAEPRPAPARDPRTARATPAPVPRDTAAVPPRLPPHLRPHQFADGTVAPVLTTDFDVSAYTRTAPGRIDVDAAALAADPGGLEDPVLRRDLAFLHRIQGSALAEARAMLSTWTGNEARITAFLATWLYERHWAADALSALLGLTDEAAPAERAGPGPAQPRSDGPGPRGGSRRRGLPRPHPGARARAFYVAHGLPVLAPLWSGTLGERVSAGHMARMSILESSLAAAHRALLPRVQGEAHRVLETVVDRSAPARAFFRLEAIARVTRSRSEALTARTMLVLAGPIWRIVGVRDGAEAEALASILSTAQARAEVRIAHEDITRFLPGPFPRALRG
ncbi:hypothetical protein [Brachybacterium hainanense]|uniref:Uncharacterized protein n=1 Tax=Brachybacterium hainanense TaxID=1541174 RepID=A0ABV6RIK6_9MICO